MTDGLAVHSRRLGHGPAPALILHCGQGSGGMWRGVMAGLGARMTATAPDFPGHGRSGPWPPGRDVHDVATEVALSFLDQRMQVIGHSFGATVALRLAMARPDRVARLTLIEPVLFAAARGTLEATAQARADAAFADATRHGDDAGAARAFNRQWGAGQRWDDLKPETRARMIGAMPFIRASEPALHDDCHGLLANGRLESLTMPVDLVRGAESQPVIPAIHRALAARLPSVRETVIGGAGHMAPVTHPAEVAGAIA